MKIQKYVHTWIDVGGGTPEEICNALYVAVDLPQRAALTDIQSDSFVVEADLEQIGTPTRFARLKFEWEEE